MSTNSKHTPGPWTVDTDKELAYVLAGPNDTEIVCEIGTVADALTEVDRANARLMAAAPEMLEALEMCRLILTSDHADIEHAVRTLNSALAKARGVA